MNFILVYPFVCFLAKASNVLAVGLCLLSSVDKSSNTTTFPFSLSQASEGEKEGKKKKKKKKEKKNKKHKKHKKHKQKDKGNDLAAEVGEYHLAPYH